MNGCPRQNPAYRSTRSIRAGRFEGFGLPGRGCDPSKCADSPSEAVPRGWRASRGVAGLGRDSASGRWATRVRARQCLAPTRSGQTPHVSQRRGDPPGRPRSFMPTRSFVAGTNNSRGMASEGGRRGMRDTNRGSASPLRGPAKRSMCPNVGATHRVALGHSCQHPRSCPRQSNREAWPRPHGPAKRSMCPNA